MKRMLERALLSSQQLSSLVAPLLDDGRTVPLLVFRLPEFSEAAWRDGKAAARRLERATSAAFRASAREVVRQEDLLAHDPGSDWFAIAMLAPARDGASFMTLDARAALERIAAGVRLVTGRRMETGWHPLRLRSELVEFSRSVESALERGARERERYEFLATIGHELRTPLTSIRGYIETLLDEGVDGPQSRRFLQTARNEALRLGRLVDGMLDFSLLDLSSVADSRRASDVSTIVREALDALAPVAQTNGIRLEQCVPQRLFGRIDSDACMHAVLNLVENAVKYGERGGLVRVSAERSDPHIFLNVDDDGPGVAEEDAAAIFALRARGTSVASRSGRGLGLAIVQTIAERAGGRVWAEKSPLGGARFTFQIFAATRASKAESV